MEANKQNDIKHKRQLTRQGWHYLVVWECEVKDDRLQQKVMAFLEGQG